jgi:Protein of unknown function (DUF4238)
MSHRVNQTKRMHTVPESYLEAFANPRSVRRTPALWRFDRISGEVKQVGIGDMSVVRDIYTVTGEDGVPDAGIEDILCRTEGAFCSIRDLVRSRATPTGKDWAGLARFVAAQLLRTPRSLQFMRDLLDENGTVYEPDAPQRVMLTLTNLAARRLGRMRGLIAYNDTTFQFLTSDNPVAAWRKTDNGYECGVDLRVPGVVVSCPLAPDVMFTAHQTAESLRATIKQEVHGERTENYNVKVTLGSLPPSEVKRMNSICVSNTHRYVYAGYNDEILRRFLAHRFFGQPPGRRLSF